MEMLGLWNILYPEMELFSWTNNQIQDNPGKSSGNPRTSTESLAHGRIFYLQTGLQMYR